METERDVQLELGFTAKSKVDHMPTISLTRIAFCPQCCNRAPQTTICMHTCTETTWFTPDDHREDEEVDFEGTYFVATCGTCQGLLLYWTQGNPSHEGEEGTLDLFQEARLMWPEHIVSEDILPTAVAAIYAEAMIVKRLSPNSFAVQIRRALEAICTDKGAKSDTLHRMLGELVRRGDLPPVLAEMTDVLRLLGNMGAHASDQPVRASQVDTLDEFFRAVTEYIYIAPSKLRRFQQRLKRFDRGPKEGET